MSTDVFGDDISSDETEVFNEEEDVMPVTHVVVSRELLQPEHIRIEATLGEESTFIKFWRVRFPEKFHYCFIDTLDPNSILDALENKLADGLYDDLAQFLTDKGRNISDPTRFRLKLDAIVRRPGAHTDSL